MIFQTRAQKIETELQEAHSRINALVSQNYELQKNLMELRQRVADIEKNVKLQTRTIDARERYYKSPSALNHMKEIQLLARN